MYISEAVCTAEPQVCETTWLCGPEGCHLHAHHGENLNSQSSSVKHQIRFPLVNTGRAGTAYLADFAVDGQGVIPKKRKWSSSLSLCT